MHGKVFPAAFLEEFLHFRFGNVDAGAV